MTSISSYGARTRPPRNPLSADPEWIHKRFERAVDIIQSLPKSGPIQTGYDDKLLLYAVYKQATEGNIKTSRPGMFDVLGRAKWDAWNKRKDLNQLDAERMYVETLIRILKGYSDRTPAVELIKELENFSIQPPPQRPITTSSSHLGAARGGGGTVPRAGSKLATTSRSNTQIYSSGSESDSEISESSTRSSGSYYQDGQGRRHSNSNLTPRQANRTKTRSSKHRNRHSSNRIPPPPADLVAPPLPGYGPPRTTTDPPRSSNRRQEQESEEDYSTGSPSSSSEDEDGLHYASVPPTAPSSVIQPIQPIQQQQSQIRPQTMAPPPVPVPTAPRSLARGGNNSPSPSIYSLNPRHQSSSRTTPLQHQQQPQQGTLLAYHHHPSQSTTSTSVITPLPPPPPLTSSNLIQQRTSSTPIAVQSQTQTQAQVPTTTTTALDSALDRIQISLTALHERLSILESTPYSSSSSNLLSSSSSLLPLSSNSPISLLLSQSFWRILILLKIRSPPPPHPTSNSSSLTGGGGSNSIRLRTLLPKLVLALFKRMRKFLGDLIVLGLVVTIVSRFLAKKRRGGSNNNLGGGGGIGDWIIEWILTGRQLRAGASGSVRGGGGGGGGGTLKRIGGGT
ncbi:hypothetical protein JCM5350_006263 [Sporobolomyces pararoseus]